MAVRGNKGLGGRGPREVHIPLNSVLSKKEETFILPHIIYSSTHLPCRRCFCRESLEFCTLDVIVNWGLDRKKGFRDRTI